MALTTRRRQHVIEDGAQPRQGIRTTGQGQAQHFASHRYLRVGLGLVDGRQRRDGRGEALFILGRFDSGEIFLRRPGGAVDARLSSLFSEGPGPDFFGDEGEERCEETQEHRKAEAQRRDGRTLGPSRVVGFAPRTDLGQLDVGVGETRPEEGLGLHQSVGLVEGVECLGGTFHQLAQLGDEGAIQLLGDGRDGSLLPQHEL